MKTRHQTHSTAPPPPPPKRSAGLLLHVTSLPGPYGVGDLGPDARRWVDALARGGQSWWQILPLGPPGAGDSPYQCYSAFAGNPLLISPDVLIEDGLLRRADVGGATFPSPGRVDFPRVRLFKEHMLRLAWERFRGHPGKLAGPLESFRQQHATWLDDFSLFMALKEHHPNKSWSDWPRDLVVRRPAALNAARRELADAVGRHQFEQFLFFRQLDALRQYARGKGVRLIGDLPIFISPESSDVWASPHLFRLDKHRRPTHVAGVPPDYFSETGQRWGNPLYHWPAMRKDGFRWWVERFRATLAQVDLVRIDHFRGFAACWEIPAHLPTAIGGRWVKAPGDELFAAARAALGTLPFIAEDLGVITPDVESLRDSLGLPGMKVLQFAFGDSSANAFLPHNYPRNTVVYTGTHDNDTTAGWFRSLKAGEKKNVRRYAPQIDGHPAWELTRLAWSSVADLAVAPVQDVLELGSPARMNVPGRGTGNWRWRMTPDQLSPALIDRLGELTRTYGRAPNP
jgi:4-alpha-glucanotransferase